MMRLPYDRRYSRPGHDDRRDGETFDTTAESRAQYATIPLGVPPFYLSEFEDAFQAIIKDYSLPKREVGIFLPCAIRKPYSTSPSHRLFRRVIGEVFPPGMYHIVIFGTCGVVPAELERTFPFAHYHYMLGKCTDERVRRDFLTIETHRLSLYLCRTEGLYKSRIAYSIGIFREAMERAIRETGIHVRLYPTYPIIARNYDIDCPFPEGSLSMEEYIQEFREGLISTRDDVVQPLHQG